jgi:hypothetical protein
MSTFFHKAAAAAVACVLPVVGILAGALVHIAMTTFGTVVAGV